ncbi:hypothetical protein [Streptomyces sp. NPDC058280]|uniref:hypothetical protein n=1 Tax=Streptomyces sp. NPDC058280 TaxID=3346419 RepID=UPI0036EBF9C4
MKIETYKGRKLKTVKGTEYGYVRHFMNGVDLGKHLGDEESALNYMRNTIDFIDRDEIDGDRWSAEWYVPGTVEKCESGHAKALDKPCRHFTCEGEAQVAAKSVEAAHGEALVEDAVRKSVDAQFPTVAEFLRDDLPVLTPGARVRDRVTGRLGTVNGKTGKVTIPGHENFGRAYTSVKWDARIHAETPGSEYQRPFVDELELADPSPARKAFNLAPLANRKLADPETVAAIHAERCQGCKGAGCPACAYKGRQQCIHGNVSAPGVQGDPIEACRTARGTEDFGVFNDEGCIYVYGCAVDVANEAVKESKESDYITWLKLCTEHEEQPAGTCEECHAVEDGPDA